MPRPCTACRDPRRLELDEAIVRGDSLRDVAGRFGTSKSALARHRAHVSKSIVRAAERRGEHIEENLVRQMTDIHARTLTLLDDAEAEKDGRLRAAAIHQARENIVVQGKLLAEARPTPAETREKARRLAERLGVPVDGLLRVAEELAAEIALPPAERDFGKELTEALAAVRARKDQAGTTVTVQHVTVPVPAGEPPPVPDEEPEQAAPALPTGPRKIGPREWEL